MREGNRDVRVGRTLAGGVVHRDPVLLTKILVGINVGVYALQVLSNGAVDQRFQMVGFSVAVNGDYYRLLSAAFLHVSITHLLFNMVALWVVGSEVERRLGRWRYLTVYLVSALAGSVFSYAVDSVFIPSVGASGAVFGLFGALFVLALKLRFDVRGIIALIVINVVIGFIPGMNINWRAHFGGLIAGALLTAAMVYAPQRNRLAISIAASAAIVAVCVGTTVWRSDQVRGCSNFELRTDHCGFLMPTATTDQPASDQTVTPTLTPL
ncbi:MAG TPA: rhomboid family intramembrane serine protease [Actinomycetes bacterium]|nr:rhomboid family intramembrane serine protease [Actinomycetes bacterium]